MSSKPVTVVARINAKRGKEDQVQKELSSLISPSRRDPGCINYDLHRSQANPTHFLFFENWESREQLDAHLAKPDLQATLARLKDLVSEPPEITMWDKIG